MRPADRAASPQRLCVLMGGMTGERDVSRATGETVVSTLQQRFHVKPAELLPDGRWKMPNGFVGQTLPASASEWFDGPALTAEEGIAALKMEKIDVVFNALHGPLCEDGNVQGFFRFHGIPLTGPETVAAAVTMDKRLTKEVLRSVGISTPDSFCVSRAILDAPEFSWPELVEREVGHVPFPWVLKPNRLGSSVGVAILQNADEVIRHGSQVLAEWPTSASCDDLLVERLVRGRELSCGVLEVNDEVRPLPPVEIRPRSGTLFDYHAKYTPGACDDLCPAPLHCEETLAVQDISVRVHEVFRCSPLSRTDLFLTPNGDLSVLEVNTLPGMTKTSLIPLSAASDGIQLVDLFAALVNHAQRRAGSSDWAGWIGHAHRKVPLG